MLPYVILKLYILHQEVTLTTFDVSQLYASEGQLGRSGKITQQLRGFINAL